MSISHQDVSKIAKLARIRVSEAEVEKYSRELSGIFQWIEQLKEVNTDGVEPMAGVGDYTLRFREDKVTDGNIREDVLANAPEAAYGCFLVPKVVE
jgi:aspartyl-tRNA(Asn)/glutamyl-tRNA(Gln) amidotransferase subunit C